VTLTRLLLPTREVFVFLVLTLGLIAAAVRAQSYLAQREPGDLVSSLSVHSDASGGGRALYLWLDSLGYRTSTLEYRRFAVDPTARLLFVLQPDRNLTQEHAQAILDWVRRGGTLVVVSDRPNPLYRELGIDVRRRATVQRDATPAQPVLLRPIVGDVWVDTSAVLATSGANWVPLLRSSSADGEQRAGASFAAESHLGRGRVFVTTAWLPFSNGGLAVANDWAFVANLLADVPRGSVVVFDEYHHGLTEQGTLNALIVREPWGWAIIYAGVISFAYVASRGRRFGPAIRPDAVSTRRTRGEYVSTVAALLRDGRNGDWLRRQYLGQVKRALGMRYGVSPNRSAKDFVEGLALRRPAATDLEMPLTRLERGDGMSELAIVRLMMEIDRLCERLIAS